MSKATKKDLVVLTADKNTQFAIQGILARYRSLTIRQPLADFFVHPQKDPGIYHNAADYLRVAVKTHQHALVLMDRIGSGQDRKTREELERELEEALSASGWEGRASAVVIDPELEIWIWSDSPRVDHELGWETQGAGLRAWMTEQGFFDEGSPKPSKPKEAMEAVLRYVRKPRSSAIYQSLAEKVSLSRCQDQAFVKLKTTLQTWFAPQV